MNIIQRLLVFTFAFSLANGAIATVGDGGTLWKGLIFGLIAWVATAILYLAGAWAVMGTEETAELVKAAFEGRGRND